jgi:CMP-N,N'-diacetyllegionaminic acid synthase
VEVLGLVPARGGSKGIPRKNLARVGGRSLLAWSVQAAQASRSVGWVVVSTDDDEIAAEAERLGAEVLRRPPELATDDAPMLGVVLHACDGLACDAVALLQPTSPLRRPEDVDRAVELLERTGADCVVSVTDVPHRFVPESLMELQAGERLTPLRADGATRRQDKPRLFARNGPAVLVVRPEAARREGTLYPADARAYVMSQRESLDVDSPLDLELVDALLQHQVS